MDKKQAVAAQELFECIEEMETLASKIEDAVRNARQKGFKLPTKVEAALVTIIRQLDHVTDGDTETYKFLSAARNESFDVLEDSE